MSDREPAYIELCYLASPHSHPDHHVRFMRFRQAIAAAAELIRQGYILISPIAHSHLIADTLGPDNSHGLWMKIDKVIFSKCNRMIILDVPGWKESVGIKQEIGWAEELRIPIDIAEWEGAKLVVRPYWVPGKLGPAA